MQEICDFTDVDPFSLARHGRYEELENLFLKGMSPDSRDEFGNSILIIGAQNGNKRIVKIALRYGSQINAKNNYGNTALHFACEYRYNKLANYLIKKGANKMTRNLRGVEAYKGIRY